jgi:two-component sensor histidine kinase
MLLPLTLSLAMPNKTLDSLLVVDRRGNVQAANDAAAALWGCPIAQLIGSAVERLIPGLDQHIDLATAASGKIFDAVAAHGDGHHFPAAFALEPLHIASGAVWVIAVGNGNYNNRLIAIAEPLDIDKEKLMEARLALAHEQRDTLVREVHHRIKNNLQSVTGLLRRQINANPSAADSLTAAISQVEVIAIVHGLQSAATLEYIRLCDMLAQIVGTANNLNSATHWVRLDNQLESPLLIVDNETVPLALILNELVTNAVKHCAEAAPRPVAVAFKRLASDTALVTITNPAAPLPPGFDFMAGIGIGMGLKLVRSLLPPQGIRIEFSHADSIARVDIMLTAPVVYHYRGADQAEITPR